MISLEQVKLLESKVTGTIDYVKKVTQENKSLKGKLDSYQKRIEELEVLIKQFKDEQSRIEDSILSALDRLNQFEDALESKLSAENTISGVSPPAEKTPAKDIAVQKRDTPAKKEKEPAGEEPAQDDDAKSSEELDIF